ncbi:hypothetical protein M595_5026 [Lyngbya aestuarii BL J]|uniref:Uncharacterized protein n=1 Tax=Lyngbya aestuarii BL J TaxID=1348334 RepID=U7QAY7_9CYAN|nr:hypothetical protein M595_5026 [Lyngbya aestuarii BL J]
MIVTVKSIDRVIPLLSRITVDSVLISELLTENAIIFELTR